MASPGLRREQVRLASPGECDSALGFTQRRSVGTSRSPGSASKHVKTCFSSDHVMLLFLMVVLLSISLLFVFSPILILSLENNTKGSLSPLASSP